MELGELIRGAQEAMDRGDFRLSAAACSHVLETFPSCLSAHRMLGEAYLEQGLADPATEHFEYTLNVDPLNVVARLGLGVANEEKRHMEQAYTAYLHAWEINPALDQVREELVRLRGLLNGDERLHPTRPGLAGIYERSGQLGRAASEWRAVLASEPENRRAHTAIAEILWRIGDDPAAAAACKEALETNPDNARALAIFADIEQRKSSNVASELATRYQLIDPMGEIAVLLAEWRDDLHFEMLRRESIQLPEFDFAAPVAYEMPATLERSPVSAPSASPALVSSQFAAPDLWDTLVSDLNDDGPPPGVDSPVDEKVQPFSWFEESDPSVQGDPFSMDTLLDARPAPAPEALPIAAAVAFAGIASQGSFEDQVAALGGIEDRSPSTTSMAMTTGLGMMATATFADSAPPSAANAPVPSSASASSVVATAPPPKPAAANPFVSADGKVDLTVGWDDLDRQLKEATPNFENTGEYDALAAELGVSGIEPFDMGESNFDDSAWAPFTDDDLGIGAAPGATAQAPVPAPVVESEAAESRLADPVVEESWDIASDAGLDYDIDAGLEPFSFDVESLDEEIASAIPTPTSSGYTDLLRNIDSEAVGDFGIDEEIDPFVNPDASGIPLEFEDLLAVTSKDGTAPLVAPVVDANDVSDLGLWSLGDSGVEEIHPPDARGMPIEEDALIALGPLDDMLVPEQPGDAAVDLSDPFAASIGSAGVAEELDLDDVLVGLGDLQPFSLDDAERVAQSETGGLVDFSEINDAPFDPASLAGVIAVATVASVEKTAPAPQWLDDSVVEVSDQQPIGAELAADSWTDLTVSAASSALSTSNVELKESGDLLAASVGERPEAEGLGIGANEVAWPAYVNHTSNLIDRPTSGGNLFGRLRDSKRQAVTAGVLTVDRRLAHHITPSTVYVDSAVEVERTPVPTIEQNARDVRVRAGGLTEAQRIDLMTMRVRLIEDDSSAKDVASALEAAISGGLNDPLASRVLGEAYLKLGRNEQAAAQFRQAMLARQRQRS